MFNWRKPLILVIKHFVSTECQTAKHVPADVVTRRSCGLATGNWQQRPRSVELWGRCQHAIQTGRLRKTESCTLSEDGTLTYSPLTLLGRRSALCCMTYHHRAAARHSNTGTTLTFSVRQGQVSPSCWVVHSHCACIFRTVWIVTGGGGMERTVLERFEVLVGVSLCMLFNDATTCIASCSGFDESRLRGCHGI
jgi:hypothetical protein